MSSKHVYVSVAAASAILSTVAVSARGQPLNAVIEVECDAFRKNPNRSWTLSRRTQMKHGIYGQLLEPSTFQKNDIIVFGFDLTRILEQNCVQSTNKK